MHIEVCSEYFRRRMYVWTASWYFINFIFLFENIINDAMYLDIILVENTCVLKRANNNEIYLLETVQVIPVN
jgi:hypothetical protein